ncbi:unnamed protein product [Mytilus edulis]|uniref:Uncharacterized protein n=1 Tax=Mytilus edulis TaxID=6550 RepID=A0A8S3QHV3_MYTED|nr:unnamed protein product [Mytilus edulis]
MVYDHDSSIVVLLDTLNEDAPLWSKTEKLLEFEKFDIELDNDQTPREVQLSIVHRAHAILQNILLLDHARIRLQKYTIDIGPVTVVCSNGATTSGLFVALSLILEKMKIDDQVDVFQVIRTIQLRRPEFVTNFCNLARDNFFYIHEVPYSNRCSCYEKANDEQFDRFSLLMNLLRSRQEVLIKFIVVLLEFPLLLKKFRTMKLLALNGMLTLDIF